MDSDERFTAFVREHTQALLRTAYLLTRNAGEAEELVQDTLAWLYPRWQQVELAEYQVAYVRKAVVNRYLAGRRRLSATEVHFDAARERASDRPVVRDRTAEVDERIALWSQLGELSERQRAALVLRFFHDLPDNEVAGVLECRVGTVRSLISRALSTLRVTGNFADDEISSQYLRNVT
jgi:RNA polymerase sigma-70 factor (sigma-E family)